MVFGSLVAFTAYIWLLGNTSIAKAGTYAYVNPIVAVLLGWAILDEPITIRTVLATLVILLGVALVNLEWSSIAWLPARLRPTRASEPRLPVLFAASAHPSWPCPGGC